MDFTKIESVLLSVPRLTIANRAAVDEDGGFIAEMFYTAELDGNFYCAEYDKTKGVVLKQYNKLTPFSKIRVAEEVIISDTDVLLDVLLGTIPLTVPLDGAEVQRIYGACILHPLGGEPEKLSKLFLSSIGEHIAVINALEKIICVKSAADSKVLRFVSSDGEWFDYDLVKAVVV